MEEIDFASDMFEDVVAKDSRYQAGGYALLMDVVHFLSRDKADSVSGEEILDEFKDRALDQYGPMTYTVLTEWGINCTEDIGEMMFNLTEGHRVAKDDRDTPESFANGYDFKEVFLNPYQT